MTPVGVLALQGDVAEHIAMLEASGCRPLQVKTAIDLEGVSALLIPGGESTTMLKLIDRTDLRDPLRKRIAGGMPVFGTCAGAILLASRVSDGEPPLGLLDVDIERNALGRQAESFEADVAIPALSSTLRVAFIRAPLIKRVGPDVEVLASFEGMPVLVQSDNILAATFHPETHGDDSLHRYFVERSCPGEAS